MTGAAVKGKLEKLPTEIPDIRRNSQSIKGIANAKLKSDWKRLPKYWLLRV